MTIAHDGKNCYFISRSSEDIWLSGKKAPLVAFITNAWLAKITIFPLYHTHEEIKIEFINKSVDADSRLFYDGHWKEPAYVT